MIVFELCVYVYSLTVCVVDHVIPSYTEIYYIMIMGLDYRYVHTYVYEPTKVCSVHVVCTHAYVQYVCNVP